MTTIILDRAVVQQVVEALKMSRRFVYADNRPQCDEAINILQESLDQYTPPQRKPLTKGRLLELYNQLPNWGFDRDSLPPGLERFARVVEQAHGVGEQP